MIDDRTEWLEADGRGGFASGTANGIRTRRYHALLLAATTPPTGRMVLVNGLETWLDTPHGSFALSSQRYAPGVTHPDGVSRIAAFTADPWPMWTLDLPDGIRITQEVVVEREGGRTVIVWTLHAGDGGELRVRPLMSGRDYHSMHHENTAFAFRADEAGAAVTFRAYEGVPPVEATSNGQYHHSPDWYRTFLYTAEHERGLDDVEDLASPGVFRWTLTPANPRAVLVLKADLNEQADSPASRDDVLNEVNVARERERTRRARFSSPLERAADAYLVSRGSGRTLVAGYPWFTDWGRDTFIALRGLCLATGRLAEARDILVEWAATVSEGMLPNRFPDGVGQPEYNSVDASLWYVVAVGELLDQESARGVIGDDARRTLERAVGAIVRGYRDGTRFGIRMDDDGLLAAGVVGQQLTWMDARIGDWVVTPRIGKPVEIQALWLNAIAVAARTDSTWLDLLDRGREAFMETFWCADGYLADVADVNHQAGARDEAFRPNQIFAVGGLPLAIVEGPRAKLVVDAVERRLLTPLGLRSLAPGEPGYAPRYEGGPVARDAVYHQGTVWPWLLGPFVEAWLRVRRNTLQARAEARQRFVRPLLEHQSEAGLGHVSEIADAEEPYTPRGCPFQAWSLGELLRIDRVVLARPRAGRRMPLRPAESRRHERGRGVGRTHGARDVYRSQT